LVFLYYVHTRRERDVLQVATKASLTKSTPFGAGAIAKFIHSIVALHSVTIRPVSVEVS